MFRSSDRQEPHKGSLLKNERMRTTSGRRPIAINRKMLGEERMKNLSGLCFIDQRLDMPHFYLGECPLHNLVSRFRERRRS